QHDSLSLSPAHDGTQSLSKLPSLSFGRPIFGPAFHAGREMSAGHLPQSSSASRFTGAFEFFILSQSGERPERYIESLRFDTIPSSPILQAWAKTVGPSPSMCSLKRRPRPALASILRSVALRTSSGSRRRSSPFSSMRSKA